MIELSLQPALRELEQVVSKAELLELKQKVLSSEMPNEDRESFFEAWGLIYGTRNWQ